MARKMEMKVENRVPFALVVAAILISLINECDKENARVNVRQQAESQVKRWENEGGAL
jgi:hypothetical protein